jgi:hypothetical protein
MSAKWFGLVLAARRSPHQIRDVGERHELLLRIGRELRVQHLVRWPDAILVREEQLLSNPTVDASSHAFAPI